MNEIKSIYMADSNHVYEIDSGQELSIKKNKLNDSIIYEVLVDGQETGDYFYKKKYANDCLKEYATDDGRLIVQGYGKHTGRKFWQLPTKLQRQVLKMAGF